MESFHPIFSTFALDPHLQQHAGHVVRKPDSSCHIISGDTLVSGKTIKNDQLSRKEWISTSQLEIAPFAIKGSEDSPPTVTHRLVRPH